MNWKKLVSPPRWILGVLLLGLAVAAGIMILRSSRQEPLPTWPDIEHAAAAKEWGRAGSMLERWLLAHPHHGEGLLQLARVRLMQDRRAEAIKLLGEVPDSSRASRNAQMTLGEALISDRRAGEAEAVFRNLAGHEPGALPPRQRLIYLLSLEQRTAEAREMLWQIARIQDDPRVLVDLVLELLRDQQDVRGFGPELEEFVKKTPDDPFLQRAWGMSLLYQGTAEEAAPHLEAAAELLENDPSGRFALAECQIVLGKQPDVARVLGPAPNEPVEAAAWWVFRGRLEETAGRADAAATAFREALKRQPASREAEFRLAQVLERLGRTAEAREHVARAGEIANRLKAARREHERVRKTGLPRDAELYEKLGQLCLEAGLKAEARAWFEWALRVDPDRAAARQRLDALSNVPDSEPVALAHPIRSAAPSHLATATDRSVGDNAGNLGETPLRFEDRSQSAGVLYQYDCGASDRLFIAETMGGGVGLIDYDGDGWLDIYLVNGCPIPWDRQNPPRPNRLYHNNGDGTFRDVTAQAGVGGRGYGMGCTVGDFDNDGRDDLFVTGLNETILYRNRGDGTFQDVTKQAGVSSDRWTTAAGFGDLDGDGDLDLVVIAYVQISLDDKLTCHDYAGKHIHCTPARYPAQPDLLFRNNGNGTFTDVSRRSGFAVDGGKGLGLAIADFDEDGRLDIFVANDATPNFLFRNKGGLQFEEIGVAAGIATNGSGKATASMGVVADDLDGDGRIDLFITNLVNESYTFLQNLGHGLFHDATLGAGLDAPTRPKTGFGDVALDADNDGVLDLFVANGHVDDRPWANSKMALAPLLFRGVGKGRFVVTGPESPSSYLARSVVGRGVACGDLDNDGRLDMVVVHRDAPVVVLSNQTKGGHWLGVKLRGKESGKTPVGARVTCKTGGKTSVRWLTSGTGYLSAHDSRLWFGLGRDEHVNRLEVRWPSGRMQSWDNVAADQILEIEEGISEGRNGLRNEKSGPAGGAALQ